MKNLLLIILISFLFSSKNATAQIQLTNAINGNYQCTSSQRIGATTTNQHKVFLTVESPQIIQLTSSHFTLKIIDTKFDSFKSSNDVYYFNATIYELDVKELDGRTFLRVEKNTYRQMFDMHLNNGRILVIYFNFGGQQLECLPTK